MAKVKKGDKFTDATGRELLIDKVDLNNPAGREIQGRIGQEEYSTDMKTFNSIWLAKEPPAEGNW